MFPNNINTLNNMRNPSHFGINELNLGRNNFSQAYQPFNQMIPQRPTNNDGNLAHNNVNQNLLSEFITEYTINVDSADRNLTNYPSPYKFEISLGGAGTSTGRINGEKTTFEGVPNPRIDMNFKNVKYVKLKYILMPKVMLYFTETFRTTPTAAPNQVKYYDANHINLTSTSIGFLTNNANPPEYNTLPKVYLGDTINPLDYSLYTKTKQHILANHRYLLLRIKELDNDKILTSTNSNRDNCFILYRDSNYHDAKNDLWVATQPTKIFYDDNLKNLSKLTIEILTPDGLEFKLKYYGLSINPAEPILIDNYKSIPITHIVNPTTHLIEKNVQLNDKEGDLFDASNINIEFEIGVCENQINTEKQYK
jgi:hypothetical protein